MHKSLHMHMPDCLRSALSRNGALARWTNNRLRQADETPQNSLIYATAQGWLMMTTSAL